MKWRRTGVFLVLLVVALAAVVWGLLRPREPEPGYEGKRLSQWLTMAMDTRFGDPENARRATNAVHHIGTNALPWLVKSLDCEIPKWREKLFDYFPGQAVYRPRLVRPLIGPAGTRAWLGLTGFEILGEEAAPAAPALWALAGNWESKDKSVGVLFALGCLGNAGSTSLVSVVTNSSIPARLRITAAHCLALSFPGPRTNVTWAIPALARCAGDPQIGNAVAATLAALAKQSGNVTPKLLEASSSADELTRQGATNALGLIPQR